MQEIKYFETIQECILFQAEPSEKLRLLAQEPWFGKYPYSMILKEQHTEQSPLHHPEGSVWEHTLLVVDEAAKRKGWSSDSRVFMWAALLHDIGKPDTTRVRSGRITAYNHDKRGAELAGKFLLALTAQTDFVDRVVRLIRYHMQILYVNKSLPFMDIPGMRKHTNLRDVALLGYCDRLGRTGAQPEAVREEIVMFLRNFDEQTDMPWY